MRDNILKTNPLSVIWAAYVMAASILLWRDADGSDIEVFFSSLLVKSVKPFEEFFQFIGLAREIPAGFSVSDTSPLLCLMAGLIWLSLIYIIELLIGRFSRLRRVGRAH